jgi:hypothetical protein
MGKISEISAQTSVIIRNYAAKLLTDIKPSDFAKKPEVGGVLIDTNHPAFTFGHLSLYPSRISKLLNLGLDEFEPPKKYFDLFSIGSKCEHDPDGKIYPTMKEITDFYFNGADKINSLLKDIPDSKLTEINTDERSKERFPILGGFINYLLTAHPNVHLGQISVWRRCMGLGPAQ